MTHEQLTEGQIEVLIDGLSDDIAFVWILIHLGIRKNPPGTSRPPTRQQILSAFQGLAALVEGGWARLGRIETIAETESGLLGIRSVRHVEEPLLEVRRRVQRSCWKARLLGRSLGRSWEWSCWLVNTPEGDEAAQHALKTR
ncbi:MAG TPA: hypothetical protein DCY40_09205 [Actinobacteria bacterium]|nr:hypothetical protein [Actinomycetota bacterium]